MGIFNVFKREKKYSGAGVAISAYTTGQPVWTERNYSSLAKEGYIENVIAYRAVREIAIGVGNIPWLLYEKDEEVIDHPLLDLLLRPNSTQAGVAFFEAFTSFYLLAGNAYIEAIEVGNRQAPITELWNLRPDRMKVIDGGKGMPGGYEYQVNGIKKQWDADPLTGESLILHFKDFHPLNDWYGLSPIEAGAYSIDQHNAAGEHNAALLQNGARPCGAMVAKGGVNADEAKRVFQMLMDRYKSPQNAGTPMLLNGDFDWKEMSMTPKELDFNNSTLAAARNIALAFGVPPMILGIPGDNTYSNYQEARLALWEQTILPLFERLATTLNGWLAPRFGEGLILKGNYDRLPALEPKRETLYKRTVETYDKGITTLNEAREQLDLDPIDGGDVVKTPAPAFGAPTPAQDGNVKKKPGRKALTESELLLLQNEINTPQVTASTQPLIDDMLASIVAEIGGDVVAEIGKRISFENSARVQGFVKNRTGALIRQINDTTRRRIQDQIGEGIAAGEEYDLIADRVGSVFEDASTTRAQMIATTESTLTAGFAATEAIAQSGLQRKRWVTTMDGHARDTHAAMNGQVVSVEGFFRSPSGQEAEYPGGFPSAAENINCRCAVIAAFDGEKSADAYRDEWLKREEKRQAAEDTMLATMRQYFDIQRDAVMDRLKILDS